MVMRSCRFQHIALSLREHIARRWPYGAPHVSLIGSAFLVRQRLAVAFITNARRHPARADRGSHPFDGIRVHDKSVFR